MTKATLEKYKDTAGFQFDEATHSYFLDGKPMTGVTTILGVLAKPALIQWAANEAIKFLKANLNELHRQVEDYDDWQWNEELFEQARTAHARKRDDAATKGTDLHGLVEKYVQNCIEDFGGKALSFGFSPSVDEAWKPITPFVNWAVQNEITFIASEQKLYSKELWVAGTADLIFEKDGKRYVGDIKTYAKIWDRVPFFQCAGYSIMWEEMKGLDFTPPNTIDGYCVLRLGKDGSFEDLWSFDVEGDRKAFLACVELYRQLQAYKK